MRIWNVSDGKTLAEISKSELQEEERLEEWLEKDISMISDNLLVIGRQVYTAYGKKIDLLCIDDKGDIVIVELKRQKTPRDITAQIIDYASWVKDLSHEDIIDIANDYLKEKKGCTLDTAFTEAFDTWDLPETLNEQHRMLIVASKIDSSTERIVNYLTDEPYRVPVNVVTFQYFKDAQGKEYLSHVFLLDPSTVESITKSSAKKKPNLTYEQLEEIANNNGVGEAYKATVDELNKYFDGTGTTTISIKFRAYLEKDNRKKKLTVFHIFPVYSNTKNGMKYEVYLNRLSDFLGIDTEKILKVLPSYRKHGSSEWLQEWGQGFFKDDNEIRAFLDKLKELKKV
jgi:hypothetical protein